MPAFDFVLAGRYRLVAPLGEGGMAAVYRGKDLRLNREVAVKVLRDELTHDPDFLTRFQREAQFVASMSHPNIVPVYDVGEEDGTHFIVMEYVRGRTLKDAIEVQGQIDPKYACDIMLPVLDALGYAHSRGLIHRDVKPHNILLTPDGTPRLADFGIAHLADGSTTRTAAILGSAEYLSPEQSRGEEATARSDIYACGIVFYEMLSGKPPFRGQNALAIAHHHLHTEPAPLPSAGMEPHVTEAIMRALAKEPDARFVDTADFARALRASPQDPELTASHPLPVLRDQGDTDDRLPVVRVESPAIARVEPKLVIRRSQRKTYLIAMLLGGLVALAAYIAGLPLWGGALPNYPSAPYALLPAVFAAYAALSWLNARSWIYNVDSNAAVVQWGLIGHHRFGVPLRQVIRLELKQSVIDRILRVGTVEMCTKDHHGAVHHLIMEDVPHPAETYDDLMQFWGRAVRVRPKAQDTQT